MKLNNFVASFQSNAGFELMKTVWEIYNAKGKHFATFQLSLFNIKHSARNRINDNHRLCKPCEPDLRDWQLETTVSSICTT